MSNFVEVDSDGENGTNIAVHNVVDDNALNGIAAAFAEATTIDSYFSSLLSASSSAASKASEAIHDLSSFSASVPQITYAQPDIASPVIHTASVAPTAIPYVPSVSTKAGSFDTEFSAGTIDAVNTSIPEPTGSLTLPSYTAPTLSVSQAVPTAPQNYGFGISAAPTIVTTGFTAQTASDPDFDDFDILIPPDLDVESLGIEVSIGELDGVIERLRNVPVMSDDIPSYTMAIPEVFFVVGTMLNGSPLVDIASVATQHRSHSVYAALSSRGLFIPHSVPEYDVWKDKYIAELQVAGMDVFTAKAVDDTLLSAMELAAAANKMATDIAVSMYDISFKHKVAVAQASTEAAKALVLAYNAEVMKLRVAAESYNGYLAEIRAEASAVQASAANVELYGRSNKLLSDAFKVRERAKLAEVAAFKARLSAETAKLSAYESLIKSYDAKVASAQIEVAQYSSVVQKYAAEVSKVSTEHALHAAKMRMVEASNSAAAAVASSQGAKTKAQAATASAHAASAAAQAVKDMVSGAMREASYEVDGIRNQAVGAGNSVSAMNYANQISSIAATLGDKAVTVSAQADANSAYARYYAMASDGINKAAQATQSANEMLAKAYAAAYEAAGKAGAAVASGSMSRFRASASLSASGNLSGSTGTNYGWSVTGSKSYGESHQRSESVSA